LSPVSTGMGDHLRVGIPPWYLIKPTRSTQPCIPPWSLNWVPALIGWSKYGNVTSAGWQVTLCDPVWHQSSLNSKACCKPNYFTLHTTILHQAKYYSDSILIYTCEICHTNEIKHLMWRNNTFIKIFNCCQCKRIYNILNFIAAIYAFCINNYAAVAASLLVLSSASNHDGFC